MAQDTEINVGINIQAESGLKSMRQMRTEIKDLQGEMTKAAEAGDKIRFDELGKQIGELKADMRDLGDEIKYADPGEMLAGTIKVAQGLAGAFGTATAAASLFGVESETLTKIEEKANQVIQLMIGLEELRSLVEGKGVVKAIAGKVAKIAVTTAEFVATNAVTAAQWLLNAAMAANPIGLVIAATAGLVAGFVLLKKWTDNVAQALLMLWQPWLILVKLTSDYVTETKRKNALDQEAIKLTEAAVAATQKKINAQQKVIDTETALLEKMKARGASEQELFQQTLKIHDEKIKMAELEMEMAQKQFDDAKAKGEMSMIDIIRIAKAKHKILLEENAKVETINADADKKEKERKEKAIQRAKEVKDARIKFAQEASTAELDLADRIEQERINNMADGLEKELEQLKFNKMLEIREYTEANAKIQADDKLTKEQKERANKIFRENILFLNKKYDTAENKLLDESLNKELEIVKAITDANIKALDDKAKAITTANLKEEEQRKTNLEKAKGMLNELADADEVAIIKRLEKFQEIAQASSEVLSFISAAMKQSSDQRIADIDAQYQKQSDSLKYQLENQLITQEQYDKRSEQLSKAKDSRIRKEKQEAWKKQHRIDVANAVTQAAIAVSQVFAYEAGELVIKSAAAVAAAAIAAGNVALIASQKMPQFAKGGMLNGPSHANGGIPIEAEGGEAILNARSMRNPMLRAMASAINVEGGGVSFATPFVSSTTASTQTINSNATISDDAIDRIVSKIAAIPVIVSEQDITKTQRKVQVIENRITH